MTNDDIPTGYYLHQNRAGTCWIAEGPGDWKYVGLRRGTRDQALAEIRRHATNPAPATKPVTEAAPAPMPTGWSNAAKRRAGIPTSSDGGVGAMLGLRSSAPAGTCHYCGLNARTCDCH